MGSQVAGGQAGGWAASFPHSLSGAYLQDHASYGCKISWMDRSPSNQSAVHRNHNSRLLSFWVIALRLYSYLNFVRSISPNYTGYGYEILWVDRSHQEGVQCTFSVTLAFLISELLTTCWFSYFNLSNAYLQNRTCYGYEILLVDRSRQGGVQCTWTVTLNLFIFWVIALCLFPYLNFVRCKSPKLY